MARKAILIVVSILLTASMLNLGGVGETLQFLQSDYYLVPLGDVTTDVQTLTQTALDREFSVLVYEGNTVTVYQDGILADVAPDATYGDQELLIVDADRFYLRLSTQSASYVVRPAETGYELVITPLEDLEMASALTAILIDLQELAVLEIDVSLDLSQIASFARNDIKGPPPPAGVGIESTLYSLVIAEDWFTYASSHGVTIAGLRVDVVAEKVPGGTLDASFLTYVVSETEQLSSLSLPIDQLLPLAKSIHVGYVRPPYRPAIP